MDSVFNANRLHLLSNDDYASGPIECRQESSGFLSAAPTSTIR